MELDTVLVDEVRDFIVNEECLNNQKESIIKNIIRRKKKGTYVRELAVKLWMYLVINGAKKYRDLYCHESLTWYDLLPIPERNAVARMLTNEFEQEIDDGEYS